MQFRNEKIDDALEGLGRDGVDGIESSDFSLLDPALQDVSDRRLGANEDLPKAAYPFRQLFDGPRLAVGDRGDRVGFDFRVVVE